MKILLKLKYELCDGGDQDEGIGIHWLSHSNSGKF